jgi:hypothetical protein
VSPLHWGTSCRDFSGRWLHLQSRLGAYAERFKGELGYLENPDYYMGPLSAQAFRAVRVIIDIGMHPGSTNASHSIRARSGIRRSRRSSSSSGSKTSCWRARSCVTWDCLARRSATRSANASDAPASARGRRWAPRSIRAVSHRCAEPGASAQKCSAPRSSGLVAGGNAQRSMFSEDLTVAVAVAIAVSR